jgi:hypothetical protein
VQYKRTDGEEAALNQQRFVLFSMGKGNTIIGWGRFFVHKRVTPVVKEIGVSSDRICRSEETG